MGDGEQYIGRVGLTAAELGITVHTQTPRLPADADLVATHPVIVPPGEAAHKLVVLGDSLSHGFKSLAVHDTDLSWPALVAESLGLSPAEFRRPRYDGPESCPGLPINVEALIKVIEAHTGGAPFWELRAVEALPLGFYELGKIRSYWEHGDGSQVPPQADYMHNLAVYGWNVIDAVGKTVGWCLDQIHPSGLRRLIPPLSLKVTHDEERAALRSLVGPAGRDTCQASAAQALGRDGIDTLVVALGSNNALESILTLRLVWTPENYLDGPPTARIDHKGGATVWDPKHFEADYAALIDEVKKVDARHVILTTVPHVTIAPICHGFGVKPTGSRYFPNYGRVWTSDDEFDPGFDDHLSSDDCRLIDAAIDMYNDVIVDHVVAARQAGLDWHLFNLCGLLDSMAVRRYLQDPSVARPFDVPYELPAALQALSPPPDTRFFLSDGSGRHQGGLIALDGVHPTTIGYGVMAHEVLKLMVAFGSAPPGTDVDFTKLIHRDSLVSDPPKTLTADLKGLGFLQEKFDIFGALIP